MRFVEFYQYEFGVDPQKRDPKLIHIDMDRVTAIRDEREYCALHMENKGDILFVDEDYDSLICRVLMTKDPASPRLTDPGLKTKMRKDFDEVVAGKASIDKTDLSIDSTSEVESLPADAEAKPVTCGMAVEEATL